MLSRNRRVAPEPPGWFHSTYTCKPSANVLSHKTIRETSARRSPPQTIRDSTPVPSSRPLHVRAADLCGGYEAERLRRPASPPHVHEHRVAVVPRARHLDRLEQLVLFTRLVAGVPGGCKWKDKKAQLWVRLLSRAPEATASLRAAWASRWPREADGAVSSGRAGGTCNRPACELCTTTAPLGSSPASLAANLVIDGLSVESGRRLNFGAA